MNPTLSTVSVSIRALKGGICSTDFYNAEWTSNWWHDLPIFNKTVLWNVRALLTPHMCSLTPREVRVCQTEFKKNWNQGLVTELTLGQLSFSLRKHHWLVRFQERRDILNSRRVLASFSSVLKLVFLESQWRVLASQMQIFVSQLSS